LAVAITHSQTNQLLGNFDVKANSWRKWW
jgi:hypothetical protein